MSSINLQMPKIPITTDLKAYYDYKSFKDNILYDYTINKYNAPTFAGTIVENSTYLSGDNAASIIFPKDMMVTTYTLIHLCKYNGERRGRIIQDYYNDWLSGFWENRNGISYNGKWITQNKYSVYPVDNWILSISTATTYRVNEQDQKENFSMMEENFENNNNEYYDDYDENDDENFGLIEQFKGFGKFKKTISKPISTVTTPIKKVVTPIAKVTTPIAKIAIPIVKEIKSPFVKKKSPPNGRRLSINKSTQISAAENSDWAFVMLALYDVELTPEQIKEIENFILNVQYKNYVKFFNASSLIIPSDLPIKSGLSGYYDSESFEDTTWYDYTKKNNATLLNGGVDTSSGQLRGNTDSQIIFPTKLLSENYTLIHIMKYNGENRKRILQGYKMNWLSGFWNNMNDVAYHGEWITKSKSDTIKNTLINDWKITVDNLNSLRSNQINMTLNNFDKKLTSSSQLIINGGNNKDEYSDWAIVAIIVYDRTLTAEEVLILEQWMMHTKYQGYVTQSLVDLNYKCFANPNSENGPVMGKMNNTYSEYEYASYNENTLIPCKQENVQESKKLNNLLCTNWDAHPMESDPELCNNAFKYYNLYKTNNPLITKGNDIKYSNKNTIEDNIKLFNLASYNSSSFPDSNSKESIQSELQNIISETPMKLGCCMRIKDDNTQKLITVRVPISPQVASENAKLKLFNFERENLTIPADTCPVDLYNGSSKCDTFYDLYCENVSNYFKQEGLPNEDMFKYAPECACYAPIEETVNYAVPIGIPPKCYKEGCNNDNKNAYIDPISRKEQCNLTVCSSLVNLSGVKAGGNISVNPVINNNCGSESTVSNTTTETPTSDDKKISNTSSTQESNNSSNNTSNNNSETNSELTSSTYSLTMIISIVVFVLIIALISGAYYFLL
jgi:hypothetical protein